MLQKTKKLFKPIPDLTLEEENHIYSLNGINIRSVSDIIKPITSFIYGDIDKDILKIAAERGNKIHSAADILISTGLDTIAKDSDLRPYIDAMSHFIADNETKYKLIGNELMVYSKTLGYAGTVDMLLMDLSGHIILVDIKSTNKIEHKALRVQFAAYNIALEEMGYKVNENRVLHLSKDGEYNFEVVSHECKQFLNLLSINNYLQTK